MGQLLFSSGWLGERADQMLAVFFFGIGGASVLVGLSQGYWQIGISPTLLGVFAAIYHPVGIPMVSEGGGAVGRRLGINGVWGNIGVAISPLAAGLMADTFGWRTAFIVPGFVSILIGFAWLKVMRATALEGAAAKKKGPESPPVDWKRVLLVVVITTALGGFIFNTTTISFPKVLDERMLSLDYTATTIGAIAMAVYVGAAFSQIVVGNMIDRYPIKPIFLTLAAGQAIALYWAISADGWPMVAAAVIVMILVFGQIPINDTLITRYTPNSWRGRVFGAKHVITFTISATVVPTIAGLHEFGGGFSTLFLIASVVAVGITATVTFLPGRTSSRPMLAES